MNLAKTDHAVSPVIATILLVAIAVVLTAIILAVVMGFSGDPNEKKVGLNAKAASGPNATLLLYGGDSIPELVELQMIDQDSPYGEYVEVWNKSSGIANVGIPYEADNVAQPTEDMAVYDTKINVKGIFSDGKESILLVQPMTFHDVNASDKVPSVPKVMAPKVSNIGPKSASAEVAYKGMTSEPTRYIVRFQKYNENHATIRSVLGINKQGNTSGTFSGATDSLAFHDYLNSTAEYAVWAEVTTPTDGTIVGEKTIFRTVQTTTSLPYLTTQDGEYVIRVDFKNVPENTLRLAKIWHRGWGPFEEYEVDIASTDYTKYVGELDALGMYYPEGYIYLPIIKGVKPPWNYEGNGGVYWVNYDMWTNGPKTPIKFPW